MNISGWGQSVRATWPAPVITPQHYAAVAQAHIAAGDRVNAEASYNAAIQLATAELAKNPGHAREMALANISAEYAAFLAGENASDASSRQLPSVPANHSASAAHRPSFSSDSLPFSIQADNLEGKIVVQNCQGTINAPVQGTNNTVNVHYYSESRELLPQIKEMHTSVGELKTAYLDRFKEQQALELRSKKEPLAVLGQNIEAEYFTVWEEPGEIQDGLAMYVAPQATSLTDKKSFFDLNEAVTTYLAQANDSSQKTQVLLLRGEAGSGKSTFNRHLARRLWQDYSAASGEQPIPLYISLPTIDRPNKNLIGQYLSDKCGFSPEQINALRVSQRFILILDGYDEIPAEQRNLYADEKLDQWQAKILLSCRPEYLMEGYKNHLQPRGRSRVLLEYQLAPFSEQSIETYIHQYVKHTQAQWSAQAYQDRLARIPNVKELLGTPFLLKMALSVLPTLDEARPGQVALTRIKLYEQFVQTWFERSLARLKAIQPKLTGAQQKAFCSLEDEFIGHSQVFNTDFALAMAEAKTTVVEYSAIARRVMPQDKRYEQFLSNKDEEKNLLRFSALLIRQQQQYRFIHKSIQDYLVARAVWEELEEFTGFELSNRSEQLNGREDMRALWEVLDPSIQVDLNALLNRLNVVEDLAVQLFLAERVQQNRALVKPLLAWIKASTSQDGTSMAAANAITILVRAEIYLSKLNLSKVNVRGADLSYGIFDQTCFKGANLSEVKFRNAWLRGANLAEANLEKVDFGELPSLEMDEGVYDCRYSCNKDWLAVSTSNKVHLYQTQTLEIKKACVGKFRSIDFSSDSQVLALGSEDNKVILWHWDEEPGGQKEELVGHEDGVLSINFSKNNKYLASGGKDGQVNLWDLKEPKILYKLEKFMGRVNSVSFSQNNELLASGRSDGVVKIWKLEEEEVSILYNLKGHDDWGVNCVKFSRNNDFLASGGSDKKVKLWKVKDGNEFYTFEGHNGRITSIDFSKDDKILASGSADKTVKLWSIENGSILHTFEGHSSWVSSVNFSTDEQTSSSQSEVLASGSYDGTVRFWKVQHGEMPHVLTRQGSWVSSANLSSDGEYLSSGSEDGIVRLWNVKDGQGSAFHTFKGHDDEVLSLAFSLESKKLASGSKDKTVMLWDVDSKELSGKLEGHESAVLGVSFSPNSAFLVSGSEDGIVKIWDVENKNALYSFEEDSVIKSMNFSLDGKFLAFGNRSGAVKIWSVESQNVEDWIEKYTFHKHSEDVKAVQFSPNGKLVASGSDDKTVRLWEINEEKENSTFAEHGDGISSLNFSKHGSNLLSGSWDGTVKVWSIDEGKCSTTHAGFVGLAGFIVWQESSENNLGMVAGSRGSAVHIWQISKENTSDVGLYWASSQNELMVAGVFGESQGLDPMNARLLEQRQKTSRKNLRKSKELEFINNF
ncbi:Myosin heavy-chain kinase [Mycoavidus cysteinexigens]|uniref:Myosin heavy-chain kinase n=1 Tax=Mycoavidus cysteinexigens TaxID=1553431 RepID=A0A2Z6ETT4_9BURK|nr:NACHT domain-containing protein [Mycoavidus cysteinexigens]BBE08826.1 Myosin heavy-chain kinase [Mycoavidus cysteinexigens]GAM52461.1 hypothetical protein EBME_0924 [bacterium endosymbiont of Mortierella elongata FMR23-6]GLR02340.1 hypothetical protein GCM10007934_21570 [Mycoavidus cysteinexigens]